MTENNRIGTCEFDINLCLISQEMISKSLSLKRNSIEERIKVMLLLPIFYETYIF